jgi:hypothetical protein
MGGIVENVIATILATAITALGIWLWSKAKERRMSPKFDLAPNAPVNPSSIMVYINSSQRLRSLERVIAADLEATLVPRESDWQWIFEQTEALGIQTIRNLDGLVEKHGHHARILARVFQPREKLPMAHGLGLVLEIEAMERFGDDWYDRFLKGLKFTSTGRGFAKDLLADYLRIKEHGG